MKKFISGFLIGALVFSMVGVWAASYVANPVDYKVLVNGKEFVSDPPALEIEGRTYLPLRAMGDVLGVPVTWNEELRQVEIGNSAPVASAEQYSRMNPAPLNTVQIFTQTNKYFEEENYTVSLRVIETVRGEKAWKMIKEANMFNDEAPEGYEYLLAKIGFSVISTKEDVSVSISNWNFTAFSSNNEEMPGEFVVAPDPELQGDLYAGGNAEGYCVFIVKKDDKNPKVVYGEDYKGAGGVWFALN